MSCKEWEQAIALLVDGEPAVTGLAEHLEDCDACRELLHDLRADQAALRTAPVVDAAAWEALRIPSRTASRWYAAAAAIAAGLVIVSILVRQPGRPVAPVAEKPTMETRVPERVASASGPARKAPKKRLRRAPAVELAIDSEWERILSASPPTDKRPAQRGASSEIAMLIQTSDPDVVILWLKEEIKRGSNE